jgi:hypothetical protein
MKRLTLLLLGLALGVATTAQAQGLTMQMSNGWSFSFAGNVNVFWVFAADSTKAGKTSSLRTGLLPAFATFDAKGKEAGMTLGVHFGFAPQIQNGGNNHDAQGAQIDMRQVYLTLGLADGSSILAGRELGLFDRQNILNDQTLFGVGAVGAAKGGGTTLGRIGYGYIYPDFNAQVTYTSPARNPLQVSVGLFQPAVEGALYSVTKMPRLEAEAVWHQTQGTNRYTVWVGGEWQSVSSNDPGDSSQSVVGASAGVKVDVSDLSVVVSGYLGKGIGGAFGFTSFAPALNDQVSTSGNLRKEDGGYVQVGYAVDKKTTIAGGWGTSRLKGAGASTSDGTDGPLGVVSLYTIGVYHQWTKSLKLVFEGSREINTHIGPNALLTLIAVPALNRTVISGGFMLFY